MSWSCREALPHVEEWSLGSPACQGEVARPSRVSGSGREILPDEREWTRGPPGCPRVVRMPSRVVGRPSKMSGSGQEASQLVGMPNRMSGSHWEARTGGREALPDVR